MNGFDDQDALKPAPAARSQPSGSSRRREHHPPEGVPAFDIKQHPAAIAYAASHPNRTIPKFGPYILLQTLGEGEFGKVKLGLHSHWAEEVAVKLIRRGNVENDVRMQKIRREIAVLEVRLLSLFPFIQFSSNSTESAFSDQSLVSSSSQHRQAL